MTEPTHTQTMNPTTAVTQPLGLSGLNQLPESDLREQLTACCAATAWVDHMIAARPYTSAEHLRHHAQAGWPKLSEADWLQAFDAHPAIGDVHRLKQKYANTLSTARDEQAGAQTASDTTLTELKALNDQYQAHFGFIFIVCATGKSADEMLDLLSQRVANSHTDELHNAALEQAKITLLRLEKLL
ncbi:MAG: 2-oxo-4-hydroxy-4-carboxy-5-ureidoimidazoline decarboxylase [Natronospirillum sp.]